MGKITIYTLAPMWETVEEALHHMEMLEGFKVRRLCS
jgi:hypothetical protein